MGTNRKGTSALVMMVAAFGVVLSAARKETPTDALTTFMIVGPLVLPAGALVVALLAIRETRASRRAQPADQCRSAAADYWQSVVALVLAASFLGTFGFYGISHYLRRTTEAATPTTTSSSWILFTSSTGDFTVLVPEAPKESTETIERPDGAITVRSVAAVGPGAGYSVMVGAPLGDGGEPMTLDRLEAEFVQRSNGKLLERSDVTAGLVAGRELRVASAQRSLRARLFVANERVYQVLVMRAAGSVDGPLDVRFLDSFTLH